MEPLFVVAKKMDHLTKMIAYIYIWHYFKCDYNQHKVLSMIMTLLPRVPTQFWK